MRQGFLNMEKVNSLTDPPILTPEQTQEEKT